MDEKGTMHSLLTLMFCAGSELKRKEMWLRFFFVSFEISSSSSSSSSDHSPKKKDQKSG